MGTKANPGRYDCYEKAEPDEPMFVLLARDPDAPELVRAWARSKEQSGRNGSMEAVLACQAKVEEARACAEAMEDWRLGQLPPFARALREAQR